VWLAAYIAFKCWFFASWVVEFVRLLLRHDFPPEFGRFRTMDTEDCPVCLGGVRFLVVLPCKHKSCLKCFCKWVSTKQSCPVCRAKFSSWIHTLDLEPLLPISLMIF
jgi:hypothetical protein